MSPASSALSDPAPAPAISSALRHLLPSCHLGRPPSRSPARRRRSSADTSRPSPSFPFKTLLVHHTLGHIRPGGGAPGGHTAEERLLPDRTGVATAVLHAAADLPQLGGHILERGRIARLRRAIAAKSRPH